MFPASGRSAVNVHTHYSWLLAVHPLRRLLVRSQRGLMFWYPGRCVLSFHRKSLLVGLCFGPERGQCELLQAYCDPSNAQSMRACIHVVFCKICYTDSGFYHLNFVGRVLVHLYTGRGFYHFAGRICVDCFGG